MLTVQQPFGMKLWLGAVGVFSGPVLVLVLEFIGFSVFCSCCDFPSHFEFLLSAYHVFLLGASISWSLLDSWTLSTRAPPQKNKRRGWIGEGNSTCNFRGEEPSTTNSWDFPCYRVRFCLCPHMTRLMQSVTKHHALDDRFLCYSFGLVLR